MKKTLITLLAIGGMACGDSITLDSKYIDANDNESSFYSLVQGENTGFNYGTSVNSTYTFYIDIADLYGASSMDDRVNKYTLTSIQLFGDPNGYYTGDSRKVSITLGSTTVVTALPTSSSKGVTLDFSETPLTFTSDSIFTVKLYSTDSEENVCVGYWDRNNDNTKSGSVTGATWGYVNEEPVYDNLVGSTVSNPQDNWAYNDIAVRINATVTSTVPEPTTATLSLLALAGLAARRRRR